MPCRIRLLSGWDFFLVSHPPRLNAKKKGDSYHRENCVRERKEIIVQKRCPKPPPPEEQRLCLTPSAGHCPTKLTRMTVHSLTSAQMFRGLSLSPALSSWREKCCNNEQRRVCKSVQRRVGGGRDRASPPPPSTYVRASPTIPLLPLSSSLRTLFAFFSPRVVRVTQEEEGKEAACLSGEQERVYLRGIGFDDISILNFHR